MYIRDESKSFRPILDGSPAYAGDIIAREKPQAAVRPDRAPIGPVGYTPHRRQGSMDSSSSLGRVQAQAAAVAVDLVEPGMTLGWAPALRSHLLNFVARRWPGRIARLICVATLVAWRASAAFGLDVRSRGRGSGSDLNGRRRRTS